MRQSLGKITAAAVLVVGLGGVAFALPGSADSHAATDSHSQTEQSGSQNDQGQSHEQSGQQTACQNREAAVNNIISRIVTRANNQITVFDTIATRTETFYTAHSKTVSNYDTLVAAIASARSKAETDLAGMKANATFSCSNPNPKATVEAFKADLKLEIADLKAYRTSIKNLIVAVKSANGITDSTTGTSDQNKSGSTNTGTGDSNTSGGQQ